MAFEVRKHVVNDNVFVAILRRLPGEESGEHRDTLVEHLASDTRIDDFVKLRQLATGVDAEPEPQGEMALGHEVHGHDPASEFDQAKLRDRCDHWAESQPPSRGGAQHPRVKDLGSRATSRSRSG